MFKKKVEEEKKVEKPVEEAKQTGETREAGEASKPSDASGSSSTSDTSKASEAAEPEKPAESAKPAEPEKPAEPDWKVLYAVTLADFDNYKKRAARDREDVYRYAEGDILKDILPTVDNLALALASAKSEPPQSGASGEDAASPLLKGVQMVYDGLLKALADHGAKPMSDLVGKDLDPNFHEAIATLPSAEVEEGKISTVAKTGWTLNDKLLRAAQVVVSAGAPA